MRWLGVDWEVLTSHLTHMAGAYALAFPIGWNREVRDHSAGLRTFPLVAVGSCAFMLIALESLQSEEARARVAYGIVTGIGFIGGGAVLKQRGWTVGTATAASIWNTGAIGIAVAWDRVEIALVLSLLNVLTFWLLTRLKHLIPHEPAERRREG